MNVISLVTLSQHYEDNLVFDWTDGTDLTFTMFAAGQPNFKNEEEECVEMKSTGELQFHLSEPAKYLFTYLSLILALLSMYFNKRHR